MEPIRKTRVVDEIDIKQAKLTSVDYLMALLRILGVISEGKAFRYWRKQKSKIFRY